MVAASGYNAYLNSHYDGMDPKRMILMLYDGALKHIRISREGVMEKNPKKRGESLGKAIDIISELNASLDPTMTDDSTEFLRGLYSSILAELPKVSLTNDIATLDLAESYISKLREIWFNDVMGRKAMDSGQTKDAGNTEKSPDTKIAGAVKRPGPAVPYGSDQAYTKSRSKSFSI